MTKKSIIFKIPILTEIIGFGNINAQSALSQNSASLQDVVDELNLTFVASLEQVGFEPISPIPRHASYRNGGYALYTTFQLVEGCVNFKLILDSRVADHESKNLESKNSMRKSGLAKLYPELNNGQAECELVDTYLKDYSGDISIFIGTTAYPNKPCKSIEEAKTILVNKVKAIIVKQIDEYVQAELRKYSDDAVSLVSDYLDDTADLTVFEFDGDDWIPRSNKDDLNRLRLEYLEVASDDGIINSLEEFDHLCEVLNLYRKYY